MADPMFGIDPQAQAALGLQPQQPGVMNSIGNFLSHPAVQGLLGTYFGLLSSPRREGLGRAIGRGGLAGLGMYGQAAGEQAQAQAARGQAVKSAFDISKDIRQQKAIQGLPPQERTYAEAGLGNLIGGIHKQDTITLANHSVADQFLAMHPNDPIAAHLAQAVRNSPEYQKPDELIKNYQEVQLNPLKLQEIIAGIQAKQATTEHEKGATALLPLTAARDQAAITASQAATGASRAATSLTPLRANLLTAEARRANQGPVPPEHLEYDPSDPSKSRYTRAPSSDPGMTFVKPPAKGKSSATAEAKAGLENLDKLEKARTSEEGIYGRGKEEVFGASPMAKHHYAMSKGINPKTGKALPPLEPGATWSEPLEDGTPTAIHADGKRYPLIGD